MKINDKYYDGFEGEPKITFCLMENGSIPEAGESVREIEEIICNVRK